MEVAILEARVEESRFDPCAVVHERAFQPRELHVPADVPQRIGAVFRADGIEVVRESPLLPVAAAAGPPGDNVVAEVGPIDIEGGGIGDGTAVAEVGERRPGGAGAVDDSAVVRGKPIVVVFARVRSGPGRIGSFAEVVDAPIHAVEEEMHVRAVDAFAGHGELRVAAPLVAGVGGPGLVHRAVAAVAHLYAGAQDKGVETRGAGRGMVRGAFKHGIGELRGAKGLLEV